MHVHWNVVSRRAKSMFSFSYREYVVVSDDGLSSCGPFILRSEAKRYAHFLNDPSTASGESSDTRWLRERLQS